MWDRQWTAIRNVTCDSTKLTAVLLADALGAELPLKKALLCTHLL
jgi:hypothetical protein